MRLANGCWLSISILALTALACGSPAPDGETGPEEERPARVETLWTERFEWFVEHPLFVVGEPSEFAAHLTSLETFEPVESGRLEVALLDGDGGVRQRVVAEGVARSGIFLPTLVPEGAGAGRVRLTYTSPEGVVDVVGWQVRVVADREQLAEAPPEADGVAFLKEQQWRIPFATVAVAAAEVRETIELPATIEAHPRGLAVVAAPATGVFRAPDTGIVTAGTAVRRGQILGRLTALPEATEGWHALSARLVEARNRVTAAEREVGRAERLVGAGAVPERRLAAARVSLENARVRLEAVEASATGVEPEVVATGELPVRASIEGVVASVRVTDGEPVDPERPLFRILDLDLLVASVEVPEPQLQRLLAARRRDISPELAIRPAVREQVGPDEVDGAAAWRTTSRLLELGTELDPASRTAPVRYEIRDAGGLFRPGMSALAQLRIGPGRQALSVPASALIDLAGVQVVYVQLGGETFEERVVQTGIRDGDVVEILSGLEAGDRVVVRGAYPVRLASLSPDAAPAHSH